MTAKQKQSIKHAVEVLQNGGVIAYPTEAVYGLGCDPNDISAVKKILELKKREKEKGLILVAANFEQLKPYLKPLKKTVEDKLLKSWQAGQSPITWLVPVSDKLSDYISGKFDTVAVRVSQHPLVKELCQKFGDAIVSTSANIATEEAARTSKEVKDIFGDKIEVILEGETNKNAQPSEIRDAISNKIIRQST